MTVTLVLALSNFDATFVVECDTSDFGIGAIFLQDDKYVAYFS